MVDDGIHKGHKNYCWLTKIRPKTSRTNEVNYYHKINRKMDVIPIKDPNEPKDTQEHSMIIQMY